MNRRRFLGGAAAFALISPAGAKDEEAYRFGTANAEIEMTIEFHDGYISRGFWFGEQMSNRRYCLSAGGDEGATAWPHSAGRSRLPATACGPGPTRRSLSYVSMCGPSIATPGFPTAPFERSIVLKKGIGSDLQAFGYEQATKDESLFDQHGPWYLYRQDLFLELQRAPFLVVYWKHALASIRVLDLIPGNQT